jgi:hypothetical protein
MATDQLSTTFSALADPTRRAILTRLSHGEATVSELAEPFPISLQAVSQRGAPLKDAAEWLEQTRAFWDVGFDRMEQRLEAKPPDHA